VVVAVVVVAVVVVVKMRMKCDPDTGMIAATQNTATKKHKVWCLHCNISDHCLVFIYHCLYSFTQAYQNDDVA
jgi:hypothetical protein